MYLVELRPGKEELYRTTEELAAAIRKGDVDMHSRIYHRATSKWISVTLHPQYKAIVAERPPAAPSVPPLERTNWTFFNDSADSLAGANDPTPDERADDRTVVHPIPTIRGAGRSRSASPAASSFLASSSRRRDPSHHGRRARRRRLRPA